MSDGRDARPWGHEVLEVATELAALSVAVSLRAKRETDAVGARLHAAETRLRAIAQSARDAGERGFGELDAHGVRRAVTLVRAADDLTVAARAAATALARRAPVMATPLALALRQTVATLPALLDLGDPRSGPVSVERDRDPAAAAGGESATAAGAPAPAIAADGRRATKAGAGEQAVDIDFAAMDNIATFHREHERYYTWQKLEMAADVSREANRLKVVGDLWLSGAPTAPPSSTDFSDPRYQAAGCEDLNALTAIAGIGVLFMEGEGEPAEIRVIKAKLRGLSFGLVSAGEWLANKMESAWERESVLLAPDLIDAAWPRLQTVTTNWRGARDTALVGKLFGLAVDCLEKGDFTPAAVRRDRASAGHRIRNAGWILDIAARLLAVSGAELAENDLRWTEYREVLARGARRSP